MKNKLEVLGSFSFYSLGLACLLVSDLYIAGKFDETFISNWAFSKSAILIIGTICLMGYDILFVRDPSLINRYFKRFFYQSVLITLIFVIFIGWIKDYSIFQLAYLFIAIICLAILNYISSSSRALQNFWKAQFAINFWKTLILLFVFVNLFDFPFAYYAISLVISLFFALLLKGYSVSKKVNINNFTQIPDKEANKLGFYFLLSNLTLIFAVNGEQFIINLYGDPISSAYLFVYISVFTPIALSVNGFIGFFYGPIIRNKKSFNLNDYLKFSKNIFYYSIVITVISIIIGYSYMVFYLKKPISEINHYLIVSLSLLCIIRGVYTSTSIGIGIFGQKESLRKSALLFWAFTGIYLLSIVLILRFLDTKYVPINISIASMLNWFARLVVSNYFTIKELKKNEAFS